MKIAIFCYGLSGRGGTETVLKSWFSFFKNENIEHKVFVFNKITDADFIQGENYELIEEGSHRKLRFYFTRDFIKNQYDIVICFRPEYVRYAQFASFFCFRKKPKIVFLSHFTLSWFNILKKDKRAKKDRAALQQCDAIFALCKSMETEYLNLGIRQEKIHLIFNPVKKPDHYIPKSKDGNKFIFMGRLEDKQKNIKGIIDVFSLIDRPFHLDIIGSGADEELLQYCIDKKSKVPFSITKLLDLIKDTHFYKTLTQDESAKECISILEMHDLRNKITITGQWMADPWAFLDEADALILNSRYEGFGLVLAEAIARGLPCISANCEVGPADIIEHGVNGYLFPVGDQGGLKSCIHKIMDGELKTSQSEISATITPMYEENYYIRFKSLLNSIAKQ